MAAITNPSYAYLTNKYLVVLQRGQDVNVNSGVAISDVGAAWVAAIKAIRVIAAGYGRNANVAPRALDTDMYLYMAAYFGYTL